MGGIEGRITSWPPLLAIRVNLGGIQSTKLTWAKVTCDYAVLLLYTSILSQAYHSSWFSRESLSAKKGNEREHKPLCKSACQAVWYISSRIPSPKLCLWEQRDLYFSTSCQQLQAWNNLGDFMLTFVLKMRKLRTAGWRVSELHIFWCLMDMFSEHFVAF